MPLFLHGASQEDRQEVARSLHQHGSTAQGPFVIAALAEALRALRGVLLFGRSALHAEAQQTEIPVSIGNSGPSWYEAACGGTLLIDEVDCLEPTQQRQLACHLVSPTREMRFLVASRHTPEALLAPGILHPALQAWLSGLAGRQVLGPERLRAVRQLPESTSEGGASGLAAALEAPMRVYLEAALENGVQALHANVVAAAEQPLISYVMQHTQGNQLKAAALLGLNRNTLRKRLQDLNIPLGASVRRNGR